MHLSLTKSHCIRISIKVLICFFVLLIAIPLIYFLGKLTQRRIYPMQYADIVTEMATEYDLPPSLVFAVIHTESKFDKNALSSANAKGLMQITDDTFRWALKKAGQKELHPDNLYVPKTNIQYGCYILTLLNEQFDNMETSLAAYNAGQGRVREWLNNPDYSQDGVTLTNIPYEETATYVRRVLTVQKRYQQIYNIQ